MANTIESDSTEAASDSEGSAPGKEEATATATPAAESGEPPEEASASPAPSEPVESQAPAAETASTEQAETVTLDGRIEGGWGYVGAAWGLSLSVLLIYVVVVNMRLRGYESAERKP